jgi:ABC-type uncharacterized transport system permease subunit
MWKEIEKLCTPAKVYLAIAILSTIFGYFAKIRVFALIAKLIFAFIYTYILNFLCKKGYQNISWFLVILPYVVMMIVMADLFQSTKK